MGQPYPDSLFRLDGKTALITGIGPGIGAHVARAYAKAGANVILAARTPEKLETLAAELRAEGARAVAAPADVGDKRDLQRLIDTALEAFGRVDILFHNAAGISAGARKSTLECTDEDWELAINVNLLAPFRLARALVPKMRSNGGGKIIHVLTTAAFQPIAPYGPYGATKAGLAMLTRQLAKECAPEVRVNAICPGTISTDGSTRDVWRTFFERELIPLQRVGRADEIVGAALYLASDASSYTTGEILFADGGRVHAAS